MKTQKTQLVLKIITICFSLLAVAFLLNLWAKPPVLHPIPPVDTNFISTATARLSAAELFASGVDVSEYDCYGCHEKDKPPPIRFDKQGNIIIPEEHENIVMGHGTHGRNNHCFNCHNENKLDTLRTREGDELKITDSTPLCGSCHGPTYRDWEAGSHGRTSGFWNRAMGDMDRKGCTSCHDPHHPKFPSRKPAPGPHPLRPELAERHDILKDIINER